MKISGLLKFSMIDFPGSISAIVFTQGCNLRCAYCHNPELIPPAQNEEYALTEEEVLEYLQRRKNSLDGVVITGGEPTLQKDLPAFASKLKAMGYMVKLDTNGTNPDMVKNLIDNKLVDFIAMDIKAPFEKYRQVCGPADTQKVKQTMDIILSSGINYQFRTTYDKEVLNDNDIEAIKAMLPDVSRFKVQECLPVKQKDVLKIER